MSHRFLPQGDKERKGMMETLGIVSVMELFSVIPKDYRLPTPPPVEGPLTEQEVVERMKAFAQSNNLPCLSQTFLGGGAYNHYIPAGVDEILRRTEFYTSYTPYQPEVSQGTLQALFEFQTLICELTGMEVANASLYEGATACVEACMVANRAFSGKKKLLVAQTLHPHYRQVLQTYLQNLDLTLQGLPYDAKTGTLQKEKLKESLDEDTLAVVFQYPNYFGVIEPLWEWEDLIQDDRFATIAVVTEPVSLSILKPPGAFGVDFVCGEGMSLGLPASYGGPYLGFLAARQKYLRRLPGRIVGQTVDREGKRGFVITLSTREQHIRREKATSNICTNQNLCALAATVFMELLGEKGMRSLGEDNLQRAHYLYERLKSLGSVELPFSSPFFNEFVVRLNPKTYAYLLEKGFIIGPALEKDYPELQDCYLLATTEWNRRQALDTFIQLLRENHG